MKPITTVLSDIGNVVALHDDRIALAALAALSGHSATEVNDVIFGDGTDQLKPFRAFMRGEMDSDRFRTVVSEKLGCRRALSKRRFEKAFGDIFTLNTPVTDLWRFLQRQGTVITAVSNLEPLRACYLVEMGVMDIFDHLVLSYEEGILKPSAELMIRALDRSGADAASAVFIDDKAKNLPPAEKLGIRTHCYENFEGLLFFLRTNDVEI